MAYRTANQQHAPPSLNNTSTSSSTILLRLQGPGTILKQERNETQGAKAGQPNTRHDPSQAKITYSNSTRDKKP